MEILVRLLTQEQELKLMVHKARVSLCMFILGCNNQFTAQYKHARL